MQLSVQPDKSFQIQELTFGDIKCIRDALAAFAKSGSAQAQKLHTEISGQIDNLAV